MGRFLLNLLPVLASGWLLAGSNTNLLTGSALITALAAEPAANRDAMILRQDELGNVPSFMTTTVPVVMQATIGGQTRTLTIQVTPDYVSFGHDHDNVRMPLKPRVAQRIADRGGYILPTRHMVNAIWAQAEHKLSPLPLTEEREAFPTFLHHHLLIEEQLGSARRGGLVAGHKKDVVVSNRLGEREGRVAIYGWHYTSGQPIQPLSIVHGENYLDYSHGVRLVRSTGLLDGTTTVTLTSILKDSVLHALLSDEGPLVHDRYNY